MNSLREMTNDFVKLERFEGGNFVRLQKKMHFLLSTLNVVYVLTTPRPAEPEAPTSQPMMVDNAPTNPASDSTAHTGTGRNSKSAEEIYQSELRKCQKWDNDDYICMGHILNGMTDSLFDIYQHETSSKTLWEKLEARYMTEDASSEKFLVSRFLNYKMIDEKPVIEQFHEIERILNTFKQYNLHMDEAIIVSAIIEKLPSSWKDMKKSLKHRKEKITLEGLGTCFRVEQEFRSQEENKDHENSGKVLMVEEGESSGDTNHQHGKSNKRKRNHKEDGSKTRKGECYYCHKTGHYKSECRILQRKISKDQGSKDKFTA